MKQNRLDLLINSTKYFLTDGGLETSLIFDHQIDLPEFAAFTLLRDEKGLQLLRKYYHPYISFAKQSRHGFILESPTWRASKKWGDKLGYDKHDLKLANQQAISMLDQLRFEFEDERTPMLISGCIGPEGDGYEASNALSVMEAKTYHIEQISTLSLTEVDMVSAFTMNYVEEAVGVALAAKVMGLPVIISFTTETDGTLPSGQTLKNAIEQVDEITGKYPIYYMVNCAHPTHFQDVFSDERWVDRIRGIRANASRKSHEELDESDELDSGDKNELAQLYKSLKSRLPGLTVLGGCCGTDHTHIEQISLAVS